MPLHEAYRFLLPTHKATGSCVWLQVERQQLGTKGDHLFNPARLSRPLAAKEIVDRIQRCELVLAERVPDAGRVSSASIHLPASLHLSVQGYSFVRCITKEVGILNFW